MSTASYSALFLVLMLLTLGVFSLLERILLASVQYRQGPVTAMAHGFTQLIADGVKIYSKYSLDILAWGSGLLIVGFSFVATLGLSMLIFGSAEIPVLPVDSDLLFFWALLGFLGSLCLLPMVLLSNRYASLGCVRQLRALIVSEIGLESFFLFWAGLAGVLGGGAEHRYMAYLSPLVVACIWAPLWILALIASARAPFDMPEAESELVAGSMTELGGSVFSLSLVLDYFEMLVWATIVGILTWVGGASSGLVLLVIVLGYIGRLILCRILLSDIPRLLFLVLLWVIGLLILGL